MQRNSVREAWSPLWPWDLEAGSLMVSEPYFESFWYKTGYKKTQSIELLEEACACCAPLWIRHWGGGGGGGGIYGLKACEMECTYSLVLLWTLLWFSERNSTRYVLWHLHFLDDSFVIWNLFQFYSSTLILSSDTAMGKNINAQSDGDNEYVRSVKR